MSQPDLKQIYLELEHEINRCGFGNIYQNADEAREDARKAINALSEDIDIWMKMLHAREISCYDLEILLDAKREAIDPEQLSLQKLDCEAVEHVRNEILRIIAKALMNSYLTTFFRTNPCTIYNR